MARNYVNLAEIMGQVDNARANEANIKRQQQQMQMEDYAYQRQLKQDQEQEALKGVYSGAIDATSGEPKLNEQKLLQDLMQRGYGDQALKLQDQFKQRDLQAGKLQNETQASNLDLLSKKATYSRDMLAKTAPDGSNYPQIRQHLIETGAAGAEVLPEQYDPNAIGSLIMKADDVIKQNTPKPTEIAFTPSGVSYNKNDPSSIKLGENYGKALEPTKPDYNKPFLPDGSPNKAFQDYEKSKAESKVKLRAVPAAISTAIVSNKQSLSKLDTAIALLEGNDVKSGDNTMLGDKEATGLKGLLPPIILNRIDPKGTDARAQAADIGSLIIHDRSGAAVTASEVPRLMPFIPNATDDNVTIIKKLKRLREMAKLEDDILNNQYNEDAGYKTPNQNNNSDKPPANPLSVIAPDGKTYTFKNKAQADGFRKSIGK
jgi:hypothetical protein